MKTIPIQVSGHLQLSERRGERPVIVRELPWELVDGDAVERQCKKNHGASVDQIREKRGFGASDAIRFICGIDPFDGTMVIPEAHAHKILNAMQVAFDRGRQTSEWRAIDAAPKDGTWILVIGPGWAEPQCVMWTAEGCWTFGSGRDCDGECAPTHWMPLPEPPADDDEGTKRRDGI